MFEKIIKKITALKACKLDMSKTKVLISLTFILCIMMAAVITPFSAIMQKDFFYSNNFPESVVFRSRELYYKKSELDKVSIKEFLDRDFYCYKSFVYKGQKHTIKLSEELQRYTYYTAYEYGVDYELILAVMGCESGWDVNVKGDGHYLGLGMISSIHLPALNKAIGTTNLSDPKQNIEAICYIMASVLETNKNNTSKALMSYNCGQAGAQKYFNKGIFKSDYSVKAIGFQKAMKAVKEKSRIQFAFHPRDLC